MKKQGEHIGLFKRVKTALISRIKNLKGSYIKALCYDDITECNIRDYQLVEERNNFRKLYKIPLRTKKMSFRVYGMLQDQVVDVYGLSRKRESKFWLHWNLMHSICQYGKTGEKKYLTDINVRSARLKAMEEDEEEMTMEKIIDYNASSHRILTQWLNSDSRKLTVSEYHNALKDYEKEALKKQMENGK